MWTTRNSAAMRWKALFEDMEAQAEAAARADLEAEVRDRTRREGALVSAADRLRPAVGLPLVVTLLGAGAVGARLVDVGPQWLLLDQPGHELVVPYAAVLSVTGLTRRAEPAAGEVARRLDLGWALRGLARDRAPLTVVLVDGTTLAGTLDRVGADHVELAEHAPGELRRAPAVRGVRLVPLNALALLRSG